MDWKSTWLEGKGLFLEWFLASFGIFVQYLTMATYGYTDLLIDNRLMCEKLAVFPPYARYTVQFLWCSQVPDRSGGWREIHVQKYKKTNATRPLWQQRQGCTARRPYAWPRSHCQHARAVRSQSFAIRVLVLSTEEWHALLKLLWGLVISFDQNSIWGFSTAPVLVYLKFATTVSFMLCII